MTQSIKKRITIALAKEDLRMIEKLIEHFEESQSLVIKRAIAAFYREIYSGN